ncbi:MAG TPA: aldo/keto reductase [Patescibacteria group bacterium]|nr:aldo/keto reductase [Patescibacteria group bacterium]
METVKLNTGAQIPQLGFGTWKIRMNGTAQQAVQEALHAGYRHVDTARIYGNEKGVGRGIAASGIARKDIFLTTKLWNGDQGYDKALRAFDASLERLGLDYVDLYIIHWPVSGKRQESWKALEQIHKSGKARAIGVSNYTVKHLEDLLTNSATVPAVNQVEFHPFLYKDQEPLLEFCKKHGIVLEAYSPLAHGKRLHEPLLTEIAALYHRSTAQILLRWALQHGTVPIVKSTHQERIIENLNVFDFELSKENMQAIDNLSDGTRTCWDPTNVV